MLRGIYMFLLRVPARSFDFLILLNLSISKEHISVMLAKKAAEMERIGSDLLAQVRSLGKVGLILTPLQLWLKRLARTRFFAFDQVLRV